MMRKVGDDWGWMGEWKDNEDSRASDSRLLNLIESGNYIRAITPKDTFEILYMQNAPMHAYAPAIHPFINQHQLNTGFLDFTISNLRMSALGL